MKNSLFIIGFYLLSGFSCILGQVEEQSDSVKMQIFISFLQEHFDDIHDVTMYYHHQNADLNGLIVLNMDWQDGRLVEAVAVENKAGNDQLVNDLITVLKTWEIDNLGPLQTQLPLRVKIVGKDDPEFLHTGIITGEIIDAAGSPLSGAKISFKGEASVPDARTNRKGIFVRTLIPPGKYDVYLTVQDSESVMIKSVDLSAGKHERINYILQ